MTKGGRIVTVRGEISPNDLGVTLPHEHLLVDCSFYIEFYGEHGRAAKGSVVDQRVSLENLWEIRRGLFSFRDNLVIDDPELLIQELERYRLMKGRSLVDLTPPSLGGDPRKVKLISEKTGLNIVYGCGFYIEPSHPGYVSEKSKQDLADELVGIIQQGYGETGIRAGILGEIGTSPTITPQETKVLSAVAAAHVRTGAPINVHLANIRSDNGPGVVGLMKENGVRMEKLALSHIDMKYDKIDRVMALAESGCFIEFDGFGLEDYVESLDFLPPRDKERVDALLILIEKGYIDQLLISQDICRKTALRKYGGAGFDHILRSVVPIMKKAGLSNREVRTIMVSNPARLLAF